MMFQAIEGSDMLWLASVDSLHRFLTEDPITEAEREAQEGTPLAFIRKWKALSALNPDLFDLTIFILFHLSFTDHDS